MGNKQGSLGHHLDTASKTGALAFPSKVCNYLLLTQDQSKSISFTFNYLSICCIVAGLSNLTYVFQKLEEFPDDLNKVSQTLRNLDLSDNRITILPSNIGNFKSLKTLNLGNNRINQLPPQIGQLVKLEILSLNGNQISQLPDTIANAKNLKELNLHANRFQKFPMVLTKLRKLDVVDLSSNNITNIQNDEISELQLTELNLNQNQLSSLSKGLAKCPRLKTLRLDENCLALEAIPAEILTESKVSMLSTKGNLFTEKQLADVEGYAMYLERYTAVKRKYD